MSKKPKRPQDVNQLAKLVADIATGQVSDEPASELAGDSNKNAAAVAMGRQGGLKGGKARAESLTPEERKEIARKAAEKRWQEDS